MGAVTLSSADASNFYSAAQDYIVDGDESAFIEAYGIVQATGGNVAGNAIGEALSKARDKFNASCP